MQISVARPGRFRQAGRVEAHGVGQPARVGQQRRGRRRDHQRARRVAIERCRQRAPRRDRLDQVGDRVGAAQPPARADPDRSGSTVTPAARSWSTNWASLSAPAERGAERQQQHVGPVAHRRHLAATSASARAYPSTIASPPRSARAGARGRARPARAPTPAVRPAAPGRRRPRRRRGATTSPVSAWATASAVPPTSVVTTGRPQRHRLEDAHRQRLGLAEQAERVAGGEQVGHVAARAEQPHVLRAGDQRLELGPLRAVAGQQPAQPGHLLARARDRLDERPDALLGTQVRHAQDGEVAARPGRASGGVASRRRPHRDVGVEQAVRHDDDPLARGSRAGPAARPGGSLTAITRSTRGATSRVSRRWCGCAASSSPSGVSGVCSLRTCGGAGAPGDRLADQLGADAARDHGARVRRRPRRARGASRRRRAAAQVQAGRRHAGGAHLLEERALVVEAEQPRPRHRAVPAPGSASPSGAPRRPRCMSAATNRRRISARPPVGGEHVARALRGQVGTVGEEARPPRRVRPRCGTRAHGSRPRGGRAWRRPRRAPAALGGQRRPVQIEPPAEAQLGERQQLGGGAPPEGGRAGRSRRSASRAPATRAPPRDAPGGVAALALRGLGEVELEALADGHEAIEEALWQAQVVVDDEQPVEIRWGQRRQAPG